jgi:four helix bundle protein
MGTIKSFEEFKVYETAREITRNIYRLTKKNAFARDFALRDQIRRAAISILSNIAEGYESQTRNTFLRHLGIAKGSAGEARAQLQVAFDQKYITESEFKAASDLCFSSSRQIAGFMRYLKNYR